MNKEFLKKIIQLKINEDFFAKKICFYKLKQIKKIKECLMKEENEDVVTVGKKQVWSEKEQFVGFWKKKGLQQKFGCFQRKS